MAKDPWCSGIGQLGGEISSTASTPLVAGVLLRILLGFWYSGNKLISSGGKRCDTSGAENITPE